MLKLAYKTMVLWLGLSFAAQPISAQDATATAQPSPTAQPSVAAQPSAVPPPNVPASVSPAAIPETPTPVPPPAAALQVEPPATSPPSLQPSAATVPSAAGDEPAPKAQAAEADPAQSEKSRWPELKLDVRLMTGFEVETYHPEGGQSVADETETGFFLEQAVVELEAKMSKRLDLEIGFNIRRPAIRDAFANYEFDRAFEVQLGRFKRPYSRLELRNRGRIPFRERGETNEALRDANLAARTLGAMMHGRIIDPILRYFVAVMSPTPIGSDIEGADLVGRIVYEPNNDLSFGLSGQHKWSERSANGAELQLSAVGADTKLEFGAFEITLEGNVFQNPNPPAAPAAPPGRTPWAFGVLGYATYTIDISKKWELEPLVVLEWFDPDLDYSGDDRLRAVAGLNVNFRRNALRLMPQVEIKRPTSDASARGEIASENYYLMVSIDI